MQILQTLVNISPNGPEKQLVSRLKNQNKYDLSNSHCKLEQDREKKIAARQDHHCPPTSAMRNGLAVYETHGQCINV